MKTTLIISLALLSVCFAKPNYYGSHNHYQGSQGTAGLSPWAQAHMDEVREMADRMKKEFNSQAYGRSGGSSSSYSSGSSSINFPNFTGKSQEELDLLAKQITEQMIADMKSGSLTYSQISQPNWFEQQAATRLEALDNEDDGMLQQQSQSVFDTGYEPGVRPDNYGTEVENLNSYDQVAHVTYPPSIAVIGGKRYVTRKNCTSVTTANSDGTVPVPVYSGSYFDSRNRETVTNYPSQVVIPVEDIQHKRESDSVQHTYYPEFNFTDNSDSRFGDFGVGNQVYVQTPSRQAKITISHMNRTITNRPGYDQPIVSGCRGTTVIVNGNVVYNHSQAIGTGSTSCATASFEEAGWKRRERERLFWLLVQGSLTNEEELQKWQQQHWQKLTRLAQEYQTTVEEIKEFQRSELKYYFDMLNRFSLDQSEFYEDWRRKEKARWDWLIQQNRITQEELTRWQIENREKLNNLARIHSISIEELLNWQKTELKRFESLLQQQNADIIRLTEWQNDVRNRLSTLMYQHNVTVEQLQENIRKDLLRLQELSRYYNLDVEQFRKWLETESLRITQEIERRPVLVVEDWQREERYRLEQITRQFNLSMDEIRERLEMDHNYIRDLANQYHVSIEKLKEWQMQEIKRLQDEGRLQTARLEAWQKQLQDQLKSVIHEHDVTVAELEEIIKRDHQRLENLAQQYQVSIWQIENWYKNEAERLFNGLKVENLEKDWKWRERKRIDDIIRQHNLTVEELEQRLISDRRVLDELALTYDLRIQELESWYESELKRLKDLGLVKLRIDVLENWQREEENRIRELIRNRNFTIEDLEQRLKHDYEHLRQISEQYRISQEQIIQWYNQEIEYLLKTGSIQRAESLTDWQIKENEYINELIKNHTFTFEDLVHRLQLDRQHLEELQAQHHIQINEIIEWYRKQAESLANRGVIKEMEMLQNWQKTQRDYIYTILEQHEVTVEELRQRLMQNQNYLNQLSNEFQISVRELEDWYRKEIQRLINQGFFERIESENRWQQQENDRIMSLIRQQTVSFDELEKILIQNRDHLYNLALKYHITTQELENWYRSQLIRLREEGKLQEITQWQQIIRSRLEELIRDHRWSIEELRERFQKNEDRLQDLLRQYHITMEQLVEWYNKELDRLYEQELIYKKNLLSWEEQERIHLTSLISQYGRSLQRIREMLLKNESLLLELANKYQITVKQLIDLYNSLINEFLREGLIVNDLIAEEEDHRWKEKERERLLFILQFTRMSYDEFIDFLRDDNAYNEMLAGAYKINVQTLSDFQLNELRQWVDTHRMKKLNLIELQDWQKRERDNLYQLIQQHSITRDQLPGWQNTNRDTLDERASRYRIRFQDLIEWQQKELQRLYELGLHYNMTFNELEQFRGDELLRISYAAHKPTTDYHDYQNWEYKENLRLEDLRRRYGFTDEQLWHWRRKLFLYCQGLLHLKRECISGSHMGFIDRDRGDQPPHMGPNECDEDNEPGIADPSYVPPPPRPSQPNLPYQTPLAPYPSTKIYSYQRNKTEKVIIGPNIHRSGYENTHEFRQESGARGAGGWQSSLSRSHSSAGSNQASSSGGSSYYGQDLQRQQPIPLGGVAVVSNNDDKVDYLSDQQQTEDLTQQFEDIGQQVQDMRGELEDLGQQRVQKPQYPAHGDKENLSQHRVQIRPTEYNRDYNSATIDLRQGVQTPQYPAHGDKENLSQQRARTRPVEYGRDYNSATEDLQQRVQKPQYPGHGDKENLSQQRVQIRPSEYSHDDDSETDDLGQQRIQQPQYPSAKEIDDLNQEHTVRNIGHRSASRINSSNDEYPAKVQEINPRLEVEAVPVTEKPGLWKRVFG